VSDFCPLKSNFQPQTHRTIVFKPGPVQGSGSGSPGFERVTGSPESIPILLKKSKRRHFSKKKVNGLQPGFLPGFAGSHQVMTFPIFSSTQPGSNPGSRAGFQNYA
jgi:hypothetical protein